MEETDVMERSCAVARGKDINTENKQSEIYGLDQRA